MAVTLLMTGYYRHPKLVHANSISGGELAEVLWTRALDHCNEHGTNGFIGQGMPPLLTPVRTAARIKGLVGAGLWLIVDSGWQVHDFLEWNRTAAELEDRKGEISRLRSEAGKRGAATRWGSRLPSVANSNGVANG